MSERKLRMQTAAKGLKVRGCDQYTINRINQIGLEVGELNEHIKDKRQLKLIIRNEVKKRMRKKYGAIGWAWFLWWILPKVVEWFVQWYFNDQRSEAKRKAKLQEMVDQARGEM